jgi:hypothetical protein
LRDGSIDRTGTKLNEVSATTTNAEQRKTTLMKMGTSTVMKIFGCGLLVFLTADLQAQLLKKIQFTPAEGYTNGWAYGQPAQDGTNVWWNTSTYPGNGWTNADGSTFYSNIITNQTPDG